MTVHLPFRGFRHSISVCLASPRRKREKDLSVFCPPGSVLVRPSGDIGEFQLADAAQRIAVCKQGEGKGEKGGIEDYGENHFPGSFAIWPANLADFFPGIAEITTDGAEGTEKNNGFFTGSEFFFAFLFFYFFFGGFFGNFFG